MDLRDSSKTGSWGTWAILDFASQNWICLSPCIGTLRNVKVAAWRGGSTNRCFEWRAGRNVHKWGFFTSNCFKCSKSSCDAPITLRCSETGIEPMASSFDRAWSLCIHESQHYWIKPALENGVFSNTTLLNVSNLDSELFDLQSLWHWHRHRLVP